MKQWLYMHSDKGKEAAVGFWSWWSNFRTHIYISHKKNKREGNISRASGSKRGEQMTFLQDPGPPNLKRLSKWHSIKRLGCYGAYKWRKRRGEGSWELTEKWSGIQGECLPLECRATLGFQVRDVWWFAVIIVTFMNSEYFLIWFQRSKILPLRYNIPVFSSTF